MLDVMYIDHIGIRVRERDRAVSFYQSLGFAVVGEGLFDKGHPVIMKHDAGVVLNILGPANRPDGPNVLMDVEGDKPAGITHFSLRVRSLEAAEKALAELGIEPSGRLRFKDLNALFIRDPDGNVIELDDYEGAEPDARSGGSGASHSYDDHP